jgi:para-nitrobenzyl esterase
LPAAFAFSVNVWQPAGAAAPQKAPVLVFIYGGSNQFGEAEPYNMSGLAAFHGVVAVNMNYRTGPIGWMAFPEDAAANSSTGNFGILDIQSALRWVQKEIGHFGGDPERVAIHGQSSGGGLTELQCELPRHPPVQCVHGVARVTKACAGVP